MKKTISAFLCVIILISALSISTFASAIFKADGKIEMKEIEGAKVQNLCEKGNSGNKVHNLISYYSINESEKEIYLALNAELYCEEVNTQGSYGVIIYIEDKPAIVINNMGETEENEEFFNVEYKFSPSFSNVKFESVITYKFPLPKEPRISVKVFDTEGSYSKIFDLDTFIPLPETTLEDEETTKRENRISSEKSKTSKKRTTKSSHTKSRKTRTSSRSKVKKDDETETVTNPLPTNPSKVTLKGNMEKVEKESENLQMNKIIYLSISCAVLLAVVLTIIFIAIKNTIFKKKEEKLKKK